MLFACLYCSLLYRNKKVKSLQDGFVERKKTKLVLYNDDMVEIDYCFDSRQLECDREYEFQQNFVTCQDLVQRETKNDRSNAISTINTAFKSEITEYLPRTEPMGPTKLVNVSKQLLRSLVKNSGTSRLAFSSPLLTLSGNTPQKLTLRPTTQDQSTKLFKSIESLPKIPKIRKSHKFKVPITKISKSSNDVIPKKSCAISNNDFGFKFEELNHNFRLETIADSFISPAQYRQALEVSIAELVNLGLSELLKKYRKLQNQGIFSEDQFRKSFVPFYEDCKLERYRANEWSIDTDSFDRQKNVLLQVSNKEQSSAYSKFDLWIVCVNRQFNKVDFFYSYNYGPAKHFVELVPMSKSWNIDSMKIKDQLFAIRAANCSTEIGLIEMLKNSDIARLEPYLIHNNNVNVACNLVGNDKCFKYLKMMLEAISKEYQLNPEQNLYQTTN